MQTMEVFFTKEPYTTTLRLFCSGVFIGVTVDGELTGTECGFGKVNRPGTLAMLL